MALEERLADVLAEYLRRPEYPYTPGLIAKHSGLPKATIVNWLEGRVAKPRHWQDLARVAAVLRLNLAAVNRLLQAGGHPPLTSLYAAVSEQADRALLLPWVDMTLEEAHTGRASHPASLPIPPTSLIGREREVMAVCALIQRPRVRLLTLCGPGGIGKTRLALQAAARLAQEGGGRSVFADGIVFVALAPISDASMVTPTVAQALGITEAGGSQPLRERLIAFLRGRRILLVLDNVEQVLAAGPSIVELLIAAPYLKVLLTSRALLHVSGEQVFPVPPLSLPDSSQLADPLERPLDLLRYEAVRLFVERVQAVQPDFALTTANVPFVVQICQHLDGLPLAIELAAARGQLLSPHMLLSRLEHRLGLLTGGARDLPARQQTLRATIDWSYSLLTPAEQRMFARLAVFVGGCTFEAAEAVASEALSDQEAVGDEVAVKPHFAPEGEGSMLDRLASLVDKQMLRRETHAAGEPRFTMLETIREYAWERLAESGEMAIIRQWHALFFLAFAERADPHLQHAEQQEWLDWLQQFDIEHDNLRAALDWAFSDGDPAIGMRLAGALAEFWWTRGHISEGRRWMRRALTFNPPIPSAARAKVLARAGTLAQVQGDQQEATTLCETAIVHYRQVGPRHDLAWALRYLGYVFWEQGEYQSARGRLEESLALCRELGDLQGGARVLHLLGYVALSQGDYGQAMAHLATGLVFCQQMGYAPVVATSLSDLVGVVARYQGDYTRASLLLESSLTRFRESGYKRGIAMTTHHLGCVVQAIGHTAHAVGLFAESYRLRQELGDRRGMAECLEALAQSAVIQEQPERAARLLGAAATLRDALDAPIPQIDQAAYKQTVMATQAQLAPATFGACWKAGQAAPLEQLHTLIAEGVPY